MKAITASQMHLIAKLLEDRADICARNEYICREKLEAAPTADYWRGQKETARNLAVTFRQQASEQ
jgi:hypothetical protein